MWAGSGRGKQKKQILTIKLFRQQGENWLKCDDDDVSPVHEEDVLKLSGGGDWHTAYLLLYGPRKLPKVRGQESPEDNKTPAAAAENMETN